MEKSHKEVKALFLDIGGVLLTNGWDQANRRNAAKKFNLDIEEMNERHHLTFDTYELGKLNLDEYLTRVVFYEKRSFSREEFKSYMYSRSEAFPDTIQYLRDLKVHYHLKMIAVSNEGRELTEHRIENFNLDSLIETFISSCFVHFRKPDVEMFRLALDVSHTVEDEVVYIDDRLLYIQVARSFGIRGIHHRSLESTRKALAEMGLALPENAAVHA